jgi:putative membrane protein
MKPERTGFWREVSILRGSITPHVLPNILIFGLISQLVVALAWLVERTLQLPIGLEVAPFEIVGAALSLLLILRTNAGYDRWWEARRLWGGIVNQSRNLVIDALAYGPADVEWRRQVVHWAAAFPHIARCSLRGDPPSVEVVGLLGRQDADAVAAADHMPGFVALKLAVLLREACDRFQMDRFAFLQVDKERALLIDHIGACERILKTPLPFVYSVLIRQFIALFLLTLPFVLLHRLDSDWLIPLITMLVALPLLSLDQIGIELQNPFSTANLNHLPLSDIAATIERNAVALSATRLGEAASAVDRTSP